MVGKTTATPRAALYRLRRTRSSPVRCFSVDEIVAFAQSWAHFNDIGGMPAGSLSPECEEIFQERIIIPPLLIGPPST